MLLIKGKDRFVHNNGDEYERGISFGSN